MKAITFTTTARREFRKLPAATQVTVNEKLSRYAETGAGNVGALAGRDGNRLRVGDYRIIFIETAHSIEVLAVGHRRDIYR